MLSANEIDQTVYDVWDQGMTLNSECISYSDSRGGRTFVNGAGLTVSLVPAGDDHSWEQRLNSNSVAAGSDSESGGAAGLT